MVLMFLFKKKNWHNHNVCSLEYRISSTIRLRLLLMGCRYCQGLFKFDSVFEIRNVSVREAIYTLLYKPVPL